MKNSPHPERGWEQRRLRTGANVRLHPFERENQSMQHERALRPVDAVPTFIAAMWPARTSAGLRIVVLTVLGSLALTLSAKLQVPFYPVPMTMQSLVVLLIGLAFGWRLGTATVLLY